MKSGPFLWIVPFMSVGVPSAWAQEPSKTTSVRSRDLDFDLRRQRVHDMADVAGAVVAP